MTKMGEDTVRLRLKETEGRWQNMVDFDPIMLCNAVESDTLEAYDEINGQCLMESEGQRRNGLSHQQFEKT